MSGRLPALPPLAEPGAPLTRDESERYSRQILLPGFGERAQRRLKAARVLVVGAGGLGSPTLLYLAGAGVGTLGIVDDDEVDLSNLHRQVVHGVDDVGRAKVDSAAEAVARLNPLVRVERHRRWLDAGSAGLIGDYDLVVDASDNFATRYLVNDACVAAGRPWVWGAALRFEGQVSAFWPGRGPVLRDLFSDAPDDGDSCSVAGVLGGLCGTVGALMGTEAVKLLTGAGRPLVGRLLVLDALDGSIRALRLTGASGAPAAPESAVPAVTAHALAAELAAAGPPPVLIDVRDGCERDRAAIAGSRHVPLADLLAEGLGDVPPDRRVVLYCAVGARSEQALRSLVDRGYRDAANLAGGLRAWRAVGLPVVAAPRSTGARAASSAD